MLTEEQVICVLQKFADQFRDELNKLTAQVDEVSKRLNMMKAQLPMPEKESQARFEVKREEPKPINHPRTGEFRPGSPEVAIESFFYSGHR